MSRCSWNLVISLLVITIVTAGCGGGGGGGSSTATATGVVTYDGQPQVGVTVFLKQSSTSPGYNAQTDGNGAFTITGVVPGSYYAEYVYQGTEPNGDTPYYEPGYELTKSVTISGPNIFNIEATAIPDPPNQDEG